MIETLISSKTRIKLLLKFFLNRNATAYLRNLEDEFGESTNAIRLELNKFESAKMLISSQSGNKKVFRVNVDHPLFKDLHNIILKYVGLDKILEHVIQRLGKLEQVYLTGNFARGIDSDIIDLVFVGEIDKQFLNELIEKTEQNIHKRIRYITYNSGEFLLEKILDSNIEPLLIWSS